MFNETAHSFLCEVVHEHLLPCRVVVTAKWVVSCTRITCIQPLSRCSLTLLASSFFSESVVVVLSVSPFFFTMRSFFFIFGLLAISNPLVSLPDYGSHFVVLLSSAFVYIPILSHW